MNSSFPDRSQYVEDAQQVQREKAALKSEIDRLQRFIDQYGFKPGQLTYAALEADRDAFLRERDASRAKNRELAQKLRLPEHVEFSEEHFRKLALHEWKMCDDRMDVNETVCAIADKLYDAVEDQFGRPAWTCAECGHQDSFNEIKHESLEGTEYDMQCPKCSSTDVRETASEAFTELADVKDKAIYKLLDGIRKHECRGDDRCWQDDQELYKLLPENEGKEYVDIGQCDPQSMAQNCLRYIACRLDPSKPYVSPQRRIEELEAENAVLRPALANADYWQRKYEALDDAIAKRNA